MGVEILGADVTPRQVEINEGNASLPTEMNGKSLSNLVQEINEPAKAGSMDSLNGTNAKVKEADSLASSNIPKDAVDEWPAPKQVRSFYFVRVRSYEDPKLKTNMGDADKDLQRMNRIRSEIIESLKEKRSERSNLKSKLQPFLAENKKHRTIMEEKMQEMKPLQEDLRKHRTESNETRERGMGLCSSEEELNELIQSLHYRIQHESNTLNQEKQLLKEIKQLEATREKVRAHSSMKAELENKKGQKAEIQDRMKLLGVNMDEVRKEKQAVMANIKQIDEEVKVIDAEIASLEEKLKSVTERRDKAYETLNALRKSRDEVNACFFQNRSLLNVAKDLAAKKDTAGLEAFVNTEVEKFMSQWNSSTDFRDDYERRILASLDSRQLSRDGRMRNPDERPIIVETPPAIKLEGPLNVAPPQGKEATKLPSSESMVSNKRIQGEEDIKSAKVDVGRKLSDEEETKKASEHEQPQESSRSKDVDPAKLKEMKREEEIAKAKAAMERKKKLAEKSAAKAAVRAQKEAEKKQKQKEKKAKKKAGTTEHSTSADETEADTKSTEPEEADVKSDSAVLEVSKEPKVNVKQRNRQKVQEQLPRVILKRKKAHSYRKWVVPAAVLALVLVVVAGYYSFGRI